MGLGRGNRVSRNIDRLSVGEATGGRLLFLHRCSVAEVRAEMLNGSRFLDGILGGTLSAGLDQPQLWPLCGR